MPRLKIREGFPPVTPIFSWRGVLAQGNFPSSFYVQHISSRPNSTEFIFTFTFCPREEKKTGLLNGFEEGDFEPRNHHHHHHKLSPSPLPATRSETVRFISCRTFLASSSLRFMLIELLLDLVFRRSLQMF
jgi:hypothetical protein